MSHEYDRFSYFPGENADEFFAPTPQPADAPSPESFDKDIDKDIEELNFNWSFDQYDDFLSSFRDNIPAVFTPSTLTYSTDSGYEFSQYAENIAPSVYSNSSEIATRGSETDGGLCTADDSIFSSAFFNGMLSFPLFNSRPI
jgi:hypothetical protein